VQRALVQVGGGTFVDNRQGGGHQQFTLVGGDVYQDGQYQYRYTANEELEVLHGPHGPYPADRFWDVEHQVELIRHAGVATNGDALHIYTQAGQAVNPWQNRRYYTPGHRYQQVPTQRVRWVDSRRQFVEQLGQPPGYRVLTPDGARVDKQYAVTKEGRDFVVPYKDLNQGFLPGLPAIYGGNVDPGEDAQAAVGREIGEESGNGAALQGGLGGQLMQQNDGGNRYTISQAQVATQAPNAPLHEMGGAFRFTTSDFVGHTGSAAATQQQLLTLFDQHLGNVGQGNYQQALQNPQQGALQQWAGSHSIQALTGKIQQDVGAYTAGRDLARTNQALPMGADAERQAGFNGYNTGVTNARAGQAAGNESAAGTGHADYLAGLAAAQGGTNNQAQVGYARAQQDYAAGLQAARAGQQAAAQHVAYAAAHAEYVLGQQHMEQSQGAVNQEVAYARAQQDYADGLADARAGQQAQHAHAAYVRAYGDYRQGSQHAQGGVAPLVQRAAYTDAFNDYHQGRQDAQQGAQQAHQTGAYALGFASVGLLMEDHDHEPMDLEIGDYH